MHSDKHQRNICCTVYCINIHNVHCTKNKTHKDITIHVYDMIFSFYPINSKYRITFLNVSLCMYLSHFLKAKYTNDDNKYWKMWFQLIIIYGIYEENVFRKCKKTWYVE